MKKVLRIPEINKRAVTKGGGVIKKIIGFLKKDSNKV